MTYSIETTAEFNEWFDDQGDKVKGFIRARFSRVELAGHFGTVKSVGGKNGLRVYFGYLERTKVLVLLGGNKNGQNQDIKKAKKILS